MSQEYLVSLCSETTVQEQSRHGRLSKNVANTFNLWPGTPNSASVIPTSSEQVPTEGGKSLIKAGELTPVWEGTGWLGKSP